LINYFACFALDTVRTIFSGFYHSALIDVVHAGQYEIKLMIKISVAIPAVGVFAEVNFFENISVVEIVDFGRGFG
jgi:hypothetical protein